MRLKPKKTGKDTARECTLWGSLLHALVGPSERVHRCDTREPIGGSDSAGRPEEPRGDMDLMAFYNLLRLYERLGKPGNYCKQLADTSFARCINIYPLAQSLISAIQRRNAY